MTRRLLLIFFMLTFATTAGTITYDWTTTLIRTPADVTAVPLTDTNWISTLSFPFWNPALFPGQDLDSVQFTLHGLGQGFITLTNSTDGPVVQSAKNEINIELNLPGGIVVIAIPTFSTGTRTIDATSSVTFGKDGPGSALPFSDQDDKLSPVITSGLTAYKGLGSYDLPVTATNNFSISGGGSFTSQATAWGSVTYEYSDAGVPEPAMLTLVGGGLLGLGFFGRRRKKA